jgi:hypothetical protein
MTLCATTRCDFVILDVETEMISLDQAVVLNNYTFFPEEKLHLTDSKYNTCALFVKFFLLIFLVCARLKELRALFAARMSLVYDEKYKLERQSNRYTPGNRDAFRDKGILNSLIAYLVKCIMPIIYR